MPPKCRFTKDEITAAALDITREHGFAAVTARAVAERLGSSPKVIFSLFLNMEDLLRSVIEGAGARCRSYLRKEMAGGKYPPYKASGMAYIRFATEEKELFRLLFMRDRSRETVEESADEIRPIIGLIRQNLGLSEEDASLFHLEMWMFTHGIAATIATSYREWDEELISRILTDGYEGLRSRFAASRTG